MPSDGLQDKVVLITGANRGLGLSLVRCFVGEGARVHGLVRSAEGMSAARAALGGDADSVVFLRADVRDDTAVAAAVASLPSLDIAINNAGIINSGPILETGTDVLRRILDTNVAGPYTVMREAARRMKPAGGGLIINVVSVAAHLGMAGLSQYCASKHALLGLGRAARQEFAPHNIRVCSVCPGMIATEMVGDCASDPRCLQPDDVARIVADIARAPSTVDVEEITIRSTIWPA